MKKYNQIFPAGETVFVGIDLHRLSWHITVICGGEVISSGAHPPEPEKLLSFLKRYQPNQIEAVYEAGYFGFSLYELLNASGIQCTVTPPTLLPMEYGNHVKTDRRDSRKLALYCAKGFLKSVSVPTVEERSHRQVIRTRRQLVDDRIRKQNQIKSFFAQYGIVFPDVPGKWSKQYIERLNSIHLNDRWLRTVLRSL